MSGIGRIEVNVEVLPTEALPVYYVGVNAEPSTYDFKAGRWTGMASPGDSMKAWTVGMMSLESSFGSEEEFGNMMREAFGKSARSAFFVHVSFERSKVGVWTSMSPDRGLTLSGTPAEMADSVYQTALAMSVMDS